MEKELFYIMQDLKRDINCLEIEYLKRKLEEVNIKCMHEEDNFNYYNKRFFLNNLKFLITKILMLGKCTRNQLIKYECIRQSLEKNLDIIEQRYEILYLESHFTEELLKQNTAKEPILKENYNKIEEFLNFVNSLDTEEKERMLSYKIGVNND